jgi:hypothetical protein
MNLFKQGQSIVGLFFYPLALIASGYSLNGQAAKIMDMDCKGFIQKPFNIQTLSQKIRSVLDS